MCTAPKIETPKPPPPPPPVLQQVAPKSAGGDKSKANSGKSGTKKYRSDVNQPGNAMSIGGLPQRKGLGLGIGR